MKDQLNQILDVAQGVVLRLCNQVSEGTMPQEALDQTVVSVYKEMTGKYTPLVRTFPAVLEAISDDTLPIIIGGKKASNRMRSNSEFRAVNLESNQITSELRMEYIKTYMEAGFTRAEAMSLLLQDIANGHAITKEISSKSSSSTSNARSSRSG